MTNPSNLPSNPTASTHSLQEREAHRDWVGGRALTLLSHYWRDDDPVELTAAIGRDWADVLEGLPQDLIQRACIEYERTEPRRKPTPGAIYQLARGYFPKPASVPISHLTDMRPIEERVTADRANELLEEAGFAAKRMTKVQA